jgi:hypothetical protein
MNWLANSLKALIGTLGVLFPSCRESARLQSDALDRQLPFFRRLGLSLHLLVCKCCRRYGRQIAFLRVAGHKCAQGEDHMPSPTLPPEARERIKRALQTNSGKEAR